MRISEILNVKNNSLVFSPVRVAKYIFPYTYDKVG